ncbi:hypothetical protein P280DRAFT_470051 [Massarina eburnea CBS 473.64]|uniref:Uncharacterized protein n=1 Tax=Massarina eburnea CBS 473.64 TaxID=1395130 RepID=A0A6A6S139_9PLEO|nr:hypothetical protein P280DRAFT_470051 [Massarina eburnea CBS 473.64]
MPMLSRTSLASIVCPSAPFLAPRLLRTPASLALSRCPLQSYATKHGDGLRKFDRKYDSSKTEAWESRGSRESPAFWSRQEGRQKFMPRDVRVSLLRKLRDAYEERQVKVILDLYPQLAQAHLLAPQDTRKIAQALHYCMRVGAMSSQELSPIVMQVVEDIQTGTLPPNAWAHVHLLGIFKECKMYDQGYTFWKWLVEKDDTYVSQAVYGAAIELMTTARKATLAELESLYADALDRFPGTFAGYHLSPDAILADRTQALAIADVPIALLQGILTARIIYGDWQSAYLALDTGLRLLPAQLPTRFFELFVFERPLPEGYTVFLMACRAGVAPSSSLLSTLLKKIRAAMTLSPSLHARIVLLRATANAIYAYLESGGSLKDTHVGSFMAACDSVLAEKAPGQDFEGDEARIRNSLITSAHEILSLLLSAGFPPKGNVFSPMIMLAGNLRVPDLLKVTLKDCEKAGITLGPVEIRTVITAAGRLGDKRLIEEYWSLIVSRAEANGEALSYNDWITLARACNRGGHLGFCREQIYKLDDTLDESLTLTLTDEMDANLFEPSGNPASSSTMTPEEFAAEMQTLKSQFRNIAATVMSGRPLDLRKTPFYMTLDPARRPLGTIEDMRTIYDEKSIDPHQPPAPPSPDRKLHISSTGFTLEDLRFQNWVSVIEMLDQAHFWQTANKNKIKDHPQAEGSVYIGQADQENLPIPLPILRQRIKELRTPGAFKASTVTNKKQAPAKDAGPPAGNGPLTQEQLVQKFGKMVYDPETKSMRREFVKTKPPALKYYVGIESEHVAPTPEGKVSRRPFGVLYGKGKRHPLGLQPMRAGGGVGHREKREYSTVSKGEEQIKDKLRLAKEGKSLSKEGKEQIRLGKEEIVDGQKKLKKGHEKMREGEERVRKAKEKIEKGTERVREGTEKALEGYKKIRISRGREEEIENGTEKVGEGTEKVHDGHEKIRSSGERQEEIKKGTEKVGEDTEKVHDGYKRIRLNRGRPEKRLR